MTSEKKEVFLTSEGFLEIEEELNELKTVKRPEIIKAIKEARALGDLSENADYHAAREEQAIIEGRIQELEYLVDHATIISEEASDKARIGSSVIIKYVGEDDSEEYKIVGSTEADPFENKISNESPIAKAIIGHKKGEIVTVESPNGKYEIEILEITVNIIITMFAMLFVIVYDLYSPAKICTNSFKILPPSNGYNGNRLNMNINIFEYITKSIGSFRIVVICVNL